MSGHTPGPWVASALDAPSQEVYGCGYRVAKMTGGEIGRDKANARLIAAAPDLLRELKNFRERFYNCMVSNGTEPEYAAISCEKADAAIAKAEGRL